MANDSDCRKGSTIAKCLQQPGVPKLFRWRARLDPERLRAGNCNFWIYVSPEFEVKTPKNLIWFWS